jgi:bifunctional UDP-N-acetylglucosamine pyrophosphorylase / glucosamine-1-phosphate N-acetyltransferase
MSRTVIVLAAGEGKRMKSALPKVLHPLLGRTLVGHVLAAAAPLGAQRTLVVVGNGAAQVEAHLAEIAPAVEPVLQAQQHGTGHAVRIALPPEVAGTVVVLNGDLPLVRPPTLAALVERHESQGAAATLLTAEVADPTGLGRIVTGPGGGLDRIVEERDATPEERRIREINAGAYAFDAALLRDALGKLSTDNDQGEEYLTDVLGLLVAAGHPVATYHAGDSDEALGANDRVQLAQLRALLRDRVNEEWMRAGVSLIDPATVWVDVTVTLARDVVIEPNTQLRGATVVEEGALVGPDTTLTDVYVGPRASVVRTHGVGAKVGPGASVGPYAYLRSGTVLGADGKIGTFVETKNAQIGTGTKVPHLSYVGDATIGEQTNIGAATVTANYDGVRKNRTVIGSHVRIGVDNMFVAPVEVGDGAYTGAGTVVRRDVPSGALSVSGGPQRIFPNWVEQNRPGTAAAAASSGAQEALGDRARAAGEVAARDAERTGVEGAGSRATGDTASE